MAGSEEEPVVISEPVAISLVLEAWAAPGWWMPEPVENESSDDNLVFPE